MMRGLRPFIYFLFRQTYMRWWGASPDGNIPVFGVILAAFPVQDGGHPTQDCGSPWHHTADATIWHDSRATHVDTIQSGIRILESSFLNTLRPRKNGHPFEDDRFHIHFRVWKLLYLDYFFQKAHLTISYNGSDNGLAAIIWTYFGLIYWCRHALIGLNKLIRNEETIINVCEYGM